VNRQPQQSYDLVCKVVDHGLATDPSTREQFCQHRKNRKQYGRDGGIWLFVGMHELIDMRYCSSFIVLYHNLELVL
jgi:hypothetical protein